MPPGFSVLGVGRLAHSLAVVAALLLATMAAYAQTAPRIVDTGRLDEKPAPALPSASVAQPPAKVRASADIARQTLMLREVRVTGAETLPAATLAPAWQGLIGHRTTVQQVYGIADAIGAAYADAGLALYQVTVPAQSFADGVAVIRVIEGRVGDVVIQGDTKGANLRLLQAYAAQIAAERPLRRATLEREILLMNWIAGLKVGSQFVALPGQPGALRLVLTVERKRYEFLAGFNNQGVSVLGRTELYVGAAANGLLQDGDRTEFVFGFPGELQHYQFYGLTHIAPLGETGATLTAHVGDLVTRPVGGTTSGSTNSGNAVVAGLALSYPFILGTRETLAGTVGFDLLESNNAILGTTVSDERTRALRVGLGYAREDDWDGVNAAGLTLSQGLDIIGARQGSPAYGGPVFTKLNLRISRDQRLPLQLIARVRAAGQLAPTHLPASEQFVYGGVEYGQAFAANPLYGDSGAEAYAELALPLQWLNVSAWSSGTEAFSFADWGRTWNRDTLFQPATDRAASAGIGLRSRLLDKLNVQVSGARAIVQPVSVPAAASWSALFTLVASF